jgi:tetratricopeptide (TPR) repeat protein
MLILYHMDARIKDIGPDSKFRYSDLGQHEKALAPTEEAVAIYRKLAEKRPDAILPNLAFNLNSLGNRYGDLGQHEKALAQRLA